MTINLTLLIQAVNFLIAYLLLKELLFRPIVAYLHQQELEQRMLQSAIEELEKKRELLATQDAQLLRNAWHAREQQFPEGQVACRFMFDDLKIPAESLNYSTSALQELENSMVHQLLERVKL